MLRITQKRFDAICGAVEIALRFGATDTMGVPVMVVTRTRSEVEAAVKGALVTLNRGEPVMTDLEQELCGFMSKDGVAFSIPPEEVMRHELEERREDARRSRVVVA